MLGVEQLLDDPRFSSNQLRYANLEPMNAVLVPVFKQETRNHWLALLEDAGVPCAPVRQITEMLADNQTKALGIIQRAPDAAMDLVGLPLSFNGERPSLRSMPPELGEHTETVKGN